MLKYAIAFKDKKCKKLSINFAKFYETYTNSSVCFAF